ncbi:MAG TPA: helix-turn-helix transcriptional regulator [Oscillospiraceae bacterium]|nr:helix-turn-helix transcriptional regulator [Oscillospiraceae bacterium]
MAHEKQRGKLPTEANARLLSVAVFSFFFSWMLAFPFEGRILYALTDFYGTDAAPFIFGAIAAVFLGLLSCGCFVKTMRAAKRLILFSIAFCGAASGAFFFPPSFLWTAALLSSSFLAGSCVSAWAFYFKDCSPKDDRIRMMADGLIGSNLLMTLLNMAAAYLSPQIGLGLSILALAAAFLLAFRLPGRCSGSAPAPATPEETAVGPVRPLAFLCVFIVVITVNSGLMYQVVNPAFEHLEWLTDWYWAIPYVAALFIMRNLPSKVNRAYILYTAIAMIGFSFLGFVSLGRSAAAYLVVNTLMLGACGIYDLFWWSILGDMLEFRKNPAMILGLGLSANVLGVLLGGLTGSLIFSSDLSGHDATLLALGVVCATLALLPPLYANLSRSLENHGYLTVPSEKSTPEPCGEIDRPAKFENLSERENQVVSLLLQGKTYRMIADELHISENTVKYYIKNIYSKFHIRSRSELSALILEKKEPAPPLF